MTLPISARETVRYVPRDHLGDGLPPTFLLAVPTVLARAQWRREVAATGARYPSDEVLIEALRAGIARVVEASQQEELLALVEEWAAAAPAERPADLGRRLTEIEQAIRLHDPRYAGLEADRLFWLAVAPLKAFQLFVIGWENLDRAYDKVNGQVSEACLAALPEALVAEVGFHAISLMSPTEGQEKNCGSPSR